MHVMSGDTIAAIATGAGAAGIGVIRLSGPKAGAIAQTLTGRRRLRPRHADYVRFADADGATIDDGLLLWFPAPASFTGEDVAELQGHGGPAVLQALLARCCVLGARRALPGEFSERAFHNGKLDLVQADAIADLIAAGSQQAARAARRALEGTFSQQVDGLAQGMIALRVQVEAGIDFADEPIDTLATPALLQTLQTLQTGLTATLRQAERGRRLRDGLHVVISGPPNAGKSSLLNALAGAQRAIVTAIAGTTRDVLSETVRSDGIEFTLVDTAGLREGGDAIEREGMRRAEAELHRADLAVVLLDATRLADGVARMQPLVMDVPQRLWIANKTDLLPSDAALPYTVAGEPLLRLSLQSGTGLDAVRTRLAALAGGDAPVAQEGAFSARERHVQALRAAGTHLEDAGTMLQQAAPELAAESLRLAHDALGAITGKTLPDAMLGHIFSTFCIGK